MMMTMTSNLMAKLAVAVKASHPNEHFEIRGSGVSLEKMKNRATAASTLDPSYRNLFKMSLILAIIMIIEHKPLVLSS